ncbi:hypothetical protein BDV40DRAFT_27920 [Aspergillus tamarii]|uniref:Uncharacterized protein n=1 Tax=Aspergillus tamarii TaxID=41984 RepID=A0A5N6UHX7_ASPTM|nr:hypothetical protein BDV40DRAFT_27920 [Aspergillus tamarii]
MSRKMFNTLQITILYAHGCISFDVSSPWLCVSSICRSDKRGKFFSSLSLSSRRHFFFLSIISSHSSTEHRYHYYLQDHRGTTWIHYVLF